MAQKPFVIRSPETAKISAKFQGVSMLTPVRIPDILGTRADLRLHA